MKNLSPIKHKNKDPHRYPNVQIPIENKMFKMFNKQIKTMIVDLTKIMIAQKK